MCDAMCSFETVQSTSNYFIIVIIMSIVAVVIYVFDVSGFFIMRFIMYVKVPLFHYVCNALCFLWKTDARWGSYLCVGGSNKLVNNLHK